jgi:hypothetical protein
MEEAGYDDGRAGIEKGGNRSPTFYTESTEIEGPSPNSPFISFYSSIFASTDHELEAETTPPRHATADGGEATWRRFLPPSG